MSSVFPDQTYKDVGWYSLLQHLAARCLSASGQKYARSIRPFSQPNDASLRSQEITQMKSVHDQGQILPLGFPDVAHVLQGILLGNEVDTKEIYVLAGVIRQKQRICHILTEKSLDLLLAHVKPLPNQEKLAAEIEQVLDENGQIRENASSVLQKTNRRIQQLHTEAAKQAQHLLSRADLEHVWQEKFVTQREGRYVLPVRAEAKLAIRGLVQDRSASGATVFVEPDALLDANNQLKLALLEKQAEEQRLLRELINHIASAAQALLQALEVMAVLDAIQACARLAADLHAQPVQTTPLAMGIQLHNARHPLLQLQGIAVIPTNVSLLISHALVISGPNAGGKTVVLKLVGLLACMIRAGLHLPVQEGSCIPWFESIFTDIGDDQSIERNVSTFSAHIQKIVLFLTHSNESTLLLVDEIATGTDPDQGAALAQALLEDFLQQGTTILATTHYPSLKWVAAQNNCFVNASVGFDFDELRPTYHLHMHVPGASETLPVAQKGGIPKQTIERTQQLISSQQVELDRMLQIVQQKQEDVTLLEQRVLQERKLLHDKEQQVDSLSQQLHAERQRIRQRIYDESITALQQTRKQIEELRESVKRQATQPTKVDASSLRKQLDHLSHTIRSTPTNHPMPYMPVQTLQAGDAVVVPHLAKTGILLHPPNLTGHVVVQLGAMKTQVLATQVQRTTPVPAKKSKSSILSVTSEVPVVRTVTNSLDVRGQRAEEAIARAEKFIDQALLQNQTIVFLIHGHGTGALRQALRSHFAAHASINKMTAADPDQGGEGVTVLFLQ